jgi:hypothetical protein
MARIIGENIKNKLIIKDQYNESSFLTVYHESATAEERIAYRSAQWKRDGNKIESRLTAARQEWGEKKIIGFKEGDFKFKAPPEKISSPSTGEGEGGGENRGEGEIRTISSDPESPNYDPNWKALLRKYAADVLEAVAEHIFESTFTIAEQDYTQKN